MDDNLFEGLQILSPSELESSLATPATEDNPEATTKIEDEGFSIVAPQEITKPVEATEEPKPEDKSTSTPNPKAEQIKALIKDLVSEGVLSLEDEAELEKIEGTFDTLKSLAEKTVDTRLKQKEENWKKSFSGAKKRFLEIEDAFSDADQAVIMAQRLDFFDKVDDTKIKADPILQKQLYFEQLKTKGFSDQKAAEYIAEAESLNKLESKALEAFPELKKQATDVVERGKQAKQELEEKQVQEQKQVFENLFNTIEEKKSFVEGLELNKTIKEKLKANITNIVHRDDKTGREFNSLMYKQSKNPVEFELLINYYDTLGLFDLDKTGNFKPDITKLKTVAKTAAVRELDKVFETEARGAGIAPNTSSKTEEIIKDLKGALNIK